MSSIVSEFICIDVKPENLGSFIGTKGTNFKKMIKEMKVKIIGKKTEITPDEWKSINIKLQFIKDEDEDEKNEIVKAEINCNKEHFEIIKEIINKYVQIHKDKNKLYEDKRKMGNTIVYRIGAKHKFIPRMIGIGGRNIGVLKNMINEIENIEKVTKVVIEEQTSRYNGKLTNIGDKNSEEYIMLYITLKGVIIYKDLHAVIKEYISKFTSDDSDVN